MKVWTRKESKERFPRAISPLGWSLLQVPLEASLEEMSRSLGVKKYQRKDMILWHNYYVYTRKDFFTHLKNLRFRPLPLLRILSGVLLGLAGSIVLLPFSKKPFKAIFSQLVFKLLFKSKIDELIRTWPAQVRTFKELMGRHYHLDTLQEVTAKEFEKIRRQMQEDSKVFFAEDFNVYFLKNILSGVLRSTFIAGGMTHKEADQELALQTAGLSGNFAIEMVEDFNNPSLSTDDLRKKFGHLTNNWDLYGKTLSEEEAIWDQRSLRVPSKKSKEKVTHEDQTTQDLLIQLCELIIMDEDLRAYSSLQYPQARRLMKLVEETKAWKNTGLPENSVYFLSLEEIETGLAEQDFHQYVDRIEGRMKEFEEALKNEPPFEVIQEGEGVSSGKKKQARLVNELKGTVISPGKTQGKVTFIKDYQDLPKLTKNNIIVIESATPVYAPFYTNCGGIVSEMGGQLSHGAIVAREFGIPMISDVEDACALLKEGQTIILDADAGTVRITHG